MLIELCFTKRLLWYFVFCLFFGRQVDIAFPVSRSLCVQLRALALSLAPTLSEHFQDQERVSGS
jgi:hypothetical protein